MEPYLYQYLPIVLQLVVVVGFVVTNLAATHFIGPKLRTKSKLESFECGIPFEGNARQPFSVKYFLVAILFVLFDVEVIFLYPWAVNFRDLGFTGFFEMLVFLAFLFAGFIYLLKKGALKWEE